MADTQQIAHQVAEAIEYYEGRLRELQKDNAQLQYALEQSETKWSKTQGLRDNERLMTFAKTIFMGTTRDGLYNGRSPDDVWNELCYGIERPAHEPRTDQAEIVADPTKDSAL